jgi:hypothetical protein
VVVQRDAVEGRHARTRLEARPEDAPSVYDDVGYLSWSDPFPLIQGTRAGIVLTM